LTDVREVEYVDECPVCGTQFVGMTPEEFREGHAAEDCPKAPLTQLLVFPAGEVEA